MSVCEDCSISINKMYIDVIKATCHKIYFITSETKSQHKTVNILICLEKIETIQEVNYVNIGTVKSKQERD